LFATDDLNIDNLLQNIEKKTDLSEKTKSANAGVSIIYTRDDIDRMQIANIQDILKLIYPVGYNENRYGAVDPFNVGASQPFVSSQIRVFIDNQEISTGLYSSGLIAISNIGIEWADHIEVYTQAPTYEFTTEPTVTLIKLYTKSVLKDAGGKAFLSTGSYGASKIGAYYAQELNDWSYFISLSQYNAKRKKYNNRGSELSRDKKMNTVVATLKKGKHNLLLTAISRKINVFFDKSLDGTPTKSELDGGYLHLGYDAKIGNLSYLLSYSNMFSTSEMTDDVTPRKTAPFYGLFPIKSFYADVSAEVIDAEIKYNINMKNNKLILGLKHRLKKYDYNKIIVNGKTMPKHKNNQQDISTAFIEDQYFLQENSIITLGVEFSKVKNNNSIQQDDLLMYRLAHTYTNDQFIIKTIALHTEMSLDPYLINNKKFLANPNQSYDTRDSNAFVENIIYKDKNSEYELILDYTEAKNYLKLNMQGKYETYNKNIIMKGINTRWKYHYNRYDKLSVELGYRRIDNIPMVNTMKSYRIILQNINTYKKFDIFNELLYSRDNIDKNNFYDYSIGIQYHYNDDLLFSVKGINILDKAKTAKYQRMDPTTLKRIQPLEISPIDRSVTFSVSYTF